jgi:hypothetical protein
MEPGSDTGNAQWKYVTTGLENDRFIEIVPAAEGDEETYVPDGGEFVLIDGHATLTHDARVRIDNFADLGSVAVGEGGGQ